MKRTIASLILGTSGLAAVVTAEGPYVPRCVVPTAFPYVDCAGEEEGPDSAYYGLSCIYVDLGGDAEGWEFGGATIHSFASSFVIKDCCDESVYDPFIASLGCGETITTVDGAPVMAHAASHWGSPVPIADAGPTYGGYDIVDPSPCDGNTDIDRPSSCDISARASAFTQGPQRSGPLTIELSMASGYSRHSSRNCGFCYEPVVWPVGTSVSRNSGIYFASRKPGSALASVVIGGAIGSSIGGNPSTLGDAGFDQIRRSARIFGVLPSLGAVGLLESPNGTIRRGAAIPNGPSGLTFGSTIDIPGGASATIVTHGWNAAPEELFDANGDGRFNSVDVTFLGQVVPPFSASILDRFDVDRDGSIGAVDVSVLEALVTSGIDSGILGDGNGDGVVNCFDRATIPSANVFITDAAYVIALDADLDGDIDATDRTALDGVIPTADVNRSGGVPDVDDVVAFWDAFNAGDPLADVNLSGGQPDIDDTIAFLQMFADGC